ncbi:MAG: hypothetical protein VKL20_00030 [Synechocystis sp.]|nr:hypothetical protein [Synechocystis sp.]
MTSAAPPTPTPNTLTTPAIFRLSPLIKITLINLYLALTVPLPLLAGVTQHQPMLAGLLTGALAIGLLALWGALSEQVVLTDQSIQVRYPTWVPSFFRSGWQLPWSEISELKCRTTGQGGLVYYFVTPQRDRAYLLPMRVAGFNRLTQLVAAQTGIETESVRPLSQPWMYFVLLCFTVILWVIEGGAALMAWQTLA